MLLTGALTIRTVWLARMEATEAERLAWTERRALMELAQRIAEYQTMLPGRLPSEYTIGRLADTRYSGPPSVVLRELPSDAPPYALVAYSWPPRKPEFATPGFYALFADAAVEWVPLGERQYLNGARRGRLHYFNYLGHCLLNALELYIIDHGGAEPQSLEQLCAQGYLDSHLLPAWLVYEPADDEKGQEGRFEARTENADGPFSPIEWHWTSLDLSDRTLTGRGTYELADLLRPRDPVVEPWLEDDDESDGAEQDVREKR
jgi:hypothetical protein